MVNHHVPEEGLGDKFQLILGDFLALYLFWAIIVTHVAVIALFLSGVAWQIVETQDQLLALQMEHFIRNSITILINTALMWPPYHIVFFGILPLFLVLMRILKGTLGKSIYSPW